MGKRVLWLENCYPISTRSARIINTLRRSGNCDVVICAWDRRIESPASADNRHDGIIRYVTPTGYSNRLAKFARLFGFTRFVKATLRAERPDAIAASFWDMAFIAALVSRRSLPFVYDVIDMPEGAGLIRTLALSAEKFALRHATAVLLASRFFEPFYAASGRRLLVLENLPDLPVAPLPEPPSREQPRIAYVGNVRYAQTLIPLLSVAAARGIRLDIWGDGALLPRLRQEYENSGLVRFHGRYGYDQLPHILGQIDLLWAAYPREDPNVRYAISNKFFESLGFALPAVFSSGTALGDYVQKHEIGYCIDASSDGAVAEFIEGLHWQSLFRIRGNLLRFRSAHADALTWGDREPALVRFATETGFCGS